LALIVLSGGCSGASSSQPKFLSIATGGTGGVYYPYGGAIARLISESLPGVQATAEVTGASVDNLKLLQLGKVDIAFTLSDSACRSTSGSGPFKSTGPVASARTLAVLYSNYTHCDCAAGQRHQARCRFALARSCRLDRRAAALN
jgi:TRAP transporter TAXI family solute receptor